MPTAGEWLARQLWGFSFLILGAVFLALSLAVAAGVYLLLARKLSVRRSVASLAAVALGVVVLIALVGTWTFGGLVPASGPKPFEAGAWQSKPWERWAMGQDLVASDRLLGMKEEEVYLLLGERDGETSYSTEAAAPGELVAWELRRLQDAFVLWPPTLVVAFWDGRVVRAWIDNPESRGEP